jgi:SAM-dependent methyltransferase
MEANKTSKDRIKKAVKEYYAGQLSDCQCSGGCCSTIATAGIGSVNYDAHDLSGVPQDAASHSFGCGNPLSFAGVSKGQTVVDIGSGAGLDAIIAARAVGPEGMVIGLDMTPEMIVRAQENVRQAGFFNVTFLLGDAESIPLEANIADWVVSNCVINLSPDKQQVFREIFRILKPGGKILISDMVVENLPEQFQEDLSTWAGCIAGAIPESEYIRAVSQAGFSEITVPDRVEYNLTESGGLVEICFPGESESVITRLSAAGTRVSSIRLSAVKP